MAEPSKTLHEALNIFLPKCRSEPQITNYNAAEVVPCAVVQRVSASLDHCVPDKRYDISQSRGSVAGSMPTRNCQAGF